MDYVLLYRAHTVFVIATFVVADVGSLPIHPINKTDNTALMTLPIPEIQEMSFFISNPSQKQYQSHPERMKPIEKSVIYIITSNQKDADLKRLGERAPHMDPWALAWYITSFVALVALFMFVSFTECLCARGGVLQARTASATTEPPPRPRSDDAPPPPYDLFAPPSYDSLFHSKKTEKKKIAVFTIPIS